MSEKKYTLTTPEWAMMTALWGKEPQIVSEIIEAMAGKVSWSYRTYGTYLKVLTDKGFVGFNTRGKNKYYFTLVDKDTCIEAEGKSLRQKLGERESKKLLICMLKETDLSEEWKDKLDALIDELAKENSTEGGSNA